MMSSATASNRRCHVDGANARRRWRCRSIDDPLIVSAAGADDETDLIGFTDGRMRARI
jgi:hypothetical protein